MCEDEKKKSYQHTIIFLGIEHDELLDGFITLGSEKRTRY